MGSFYGSLHEVGAADHLNFFPISGNMEVSKSRLKLEVESAKKTLWPTYLKTVMYLKEHNDK